MFAVKGTTVLAALDTTVGTKTGRLFQSTDGGATWPTTLTAADGFCGGQCFYDMARCDRPSKLGAEPADLPRRKRTRNVHRRHEGVQQRRRDVHA